MWIGGKEMIGEVVEKQRAREIYESYKQRGAIRGCWSRWTTNDSKCESSRFPPAPSSG